MPSRQHWAGITAISHLFRKGLLLMSTKKEAPRTRRPEKVFRIGYVSASVFAHEVEGDNGNRVVRSVNVQKRYTDGDEVKYTSSFSLPELSQALRVLQLAAEWVESHEASVQLDS